MMHQAGTGPRGAAVTTAAGHHSRVDTAVTEVWPAPSPTHKRRDPSGAAAFESSLQRAGKRPRVGAYTSNSGSTAATPSAGLSHGARHYLHPWQAQLGQSMGPASTATSVAGASVGGTVVPPFGMPGASSVAGPTASVFVPSSVAAVQPMLGAQAQPQSQLAMQPQQQQQDLAAAAVAQAQAEQAQAAKAHADAQDQYAAALRSYGMASHQQGVFSATTPAATLAAYNSLNGNVSAGLPATSMPYMKMEQTPASIMTTGVTTADATAMAAQANPAYAAALLQSQLGAQFPYGNTGFGAMGAVPGLAGVGAGVGGVGGVGGAAYPPSVMYAALAQQQWLQTLYNQAQPGAMGMAGLGMAGLGSAATTSGMMPGIPTMPGLTPALPSAGYPDYGQSEAMAAARLAALGGSQSRGATTAAPVSSDASEDARRSATLAAFLPGSSDPVMAAAAAAGLTTVDGSAGRSRHTYNFGFKGITQTRHGRWQAQIHVNGPAMYLGTFPTPLEAALVYDLNVVKHKGPTAPRNFPHDNPADMLAAIFGPARRQQNFKGVSHCGTRWRAKIYNGGKSIHLGHFDTAQQAALAYDMAARRLRGADAKTNFPPTGAAASGAKGQSNCLISEAPQESESVLKTLRTTVEAAVTAALTGVSSAARSKAAAAKAAAAKLAILGPAALALIASRKATDGDCDGSQEPEPAAGTDSKTQRDSSGNGAGNGTSGDAGVATDVQRSGKGAERDRSMKRARDGSRRSSTHMRPVTGSSSDNDSSDGGSRGTSRGASSTDEAMLSATDSARSRSSGTSRSSGSSSDRMARAGSGSSGDDRGSRTSGSGDDASSQ